MQTRRSQRQLPGSTAPVVTYSRQRESELDAWDDERAEPRFDEEPVAEWDAVEVPPVEPPLRSRRPSRRAPEPAPQPEDVADLADTPRSRTRNRRSTPMRLVAVAVLALVVVGLAVLAYTVTTTTAVTVSTPALRDETAAEAANTDDVAAVPGAVREIPLTGGSGEGAAASVMPAVPAEPPAPRARPDRPVPATAAVNPDFDHAAPAPAEPAPAAAAPAGTGPDDDFIARIERTLAESRNRAAAEPGLSPALAPQAAPPAAVSQPLPAGPIPPADIPLTGADGQRLVLPPDFLVIDTE